MKSTCVLAVCSPALYTIQETKIFDRSYRPPGDSHCPKLPITKWDKLSNYGAGN